MIQLVTAFLAESADEVYGCDIADDNHRSLRTFTKAGYEQINAIPQQSNKASLRSDFGITREQFLRLRQHD